MSEYVSPYSYRLPPDTFLYRKDANWYIGGSAGFTPEQKAALLDQAKRNFIAAADDLVSATRTACQRIRENANIMGYSRVEEVCSRIEGNVKQGVDRLKAVDAQGVPLFVRNPQAAKDILALIQENADSELQDIKQLMTETGYVNLFGEWGFDSLKNLITQAVAKLAEIIQTLIMLFASSFQEVAKKAPLVAILALAGTAAYVYFKFLR